MAKKKTYDSDLVQVFPNSGGVGLSDLKEAGLADTITAAPVTDLGGGKYQAQDLPAGYSYVTNGQQANDPAQTEANRGSWAVADNAYLSDDHWNEIQQFKAQYEQAKAAGDQAGMDAAHQAAEQLRYQYGYSGGVDGSNYLPTMAYTGVSGREEADGGGGGGFNDPGYLSKYQARIDALADAILNRAPFSYDKENDPLYKQYEESYTRNGQRGMQDTLAQVSARTGGLASSYAQTAAQQTFNNYMAALADKVPELYQLAYSMYMDDLNQDRNDLNMLMGLDDTAYGRWADDRNFDYGMYRDGVADSQWQQQFDYGVSRDQVADSRYESETAYDRAMQMLMMGINPGEGMLGAAGIGGDLAQSIIGANTPTVGGGSYGGGGGLPETVEPTDWEALQGMRSEAEVIEYLKKAGYDKAEREAMTQQWRFHRYNKENNAVSSPAEDDYVSVPNYGKITFDQAERLEEQGAIILVGMQNGKPVYSLPDDWNKSNKVFETTR